ncbi:DMT family transporter [Alteriqipengyuania sp. 357]
MPSRTIALLVLVNLLWALNVVVSKIAVADLGMPPIFYAALRALVSMLVLVPFLRPLPKNWPIVAAVGLAIGGGSFALLAIGLKSASPSTAGIVSLSGAPMTVLLAIVLLGEHVGWRRGLGIALAIIGVVIAVASPSGWESSAGLGWIGLSCLVGALGAVYVKKIDVGGKQLQAWSAFASFAVLLPFAFVTEPIPIEPLMTDPFKLLGCLIFAGLIVSVYAHVIYFNALKEHDANLVVPFTLLHPLMTVALGAWLTGDPVGVPLLLGGAIAVGGVAILVLRPSETFTKRFLVRPRL